VEHCVTREAAVDVVVEDAKILWRHVQVCDIGIAELVNEVESKLKGREVRGH